MRYKKRPVEVDAFAFTGHALSAADAIRWARTSLGPDADNPISYDKERTDKGEYFVLRIKTLEGVMTAKPGDYIIKGVAGEFYPCKPQIFEQTYELV